MPYSVETWRYIFEQSLLAKAAYADLEGVGFANDVLFGEQLRTTGRERMPRYAAEYLAASFGVIHHQADTSSSYSGTLFARRQMTDPSLSSDDFTFALRGTDDPLDRYSWITIATSGGAAAEQQWDMYRHWEGLLSDTSGYILDASVRSALQSAQVNVTGHSLGGNLTTYFSAFRSESLGAASTFNTATAVIPIGIPIPTAQMSNFVGSAYPDIIQSPGNFYGTVDTIFTEPDTTIVTTRGHSMENLLMGIASRYLLSLIDPSTSDSKAMSVFESITTDGTNSFERFATALRLLFGVAEKENETDGDGTIFELIGQFEAGRAPGNLIPLVGIEPDDLRTQAGAPTPSGNAIRFALVHGLPFAVDGAGVTVHESSEYEAANYSAEYLASRVEYVQHLWERNAADVSFATSIDPDVVYNDRATDTWLANVANWQGVPDAKYIVFGTNPDPNGVGGDDALAGGAFSDRLFGAGGNDRLQGGAGDDLLDGGAGDDILEGQSGSTVANGGTGRDTYVLSDGDGHLTIRGDDGLGVGGTKDVISILGTTSYVLGNTQLQRLAAGSDVYTDDHGNRFTLVGTALEVVLADGRSITIEEFQNGDFGIDLATAVDMAPAMAAEVVTATSVPGDRPDRAVARGRGAGIEQGHRPRARRSIRHDQGRLIAVHAPRRDRRRSDVGQRRRLAG